MYFLHPLPRPQLGPSLLYIRAYLSSFSFLVCNEFMKSTINNNGYSARCSILARPLRMEDGIAIIEY